MRTGEAICHKTQTSRPPREGTLRTARFFVAWGVVLLRAGQGVVSALLLLVHIHVDDALVSRAFALERIAVALKARVSVEERRDGRFVLG